MTMSISLHQMAEQVEALTPLPELWEAAVEQVLSGSLQRGPLMSCVEKDVVLTFRILIVANSEEYGKPGHMIALEQAFEYLGLDMIQNLILSTSCDDTPGPSLYGQRLEYETFWKHSLACSVFSRRIAEKALPALVDEALIAGLLHDLGKLLMNQTDPERCGRIIPRDGEKALLMQERETFDSTHSEVGEMVSEHLKLPKLIQTVCGKHHLSWEELNLGEESDLLSACVGLADLLTYRLNIGSGGNPARRMESLPKLGRIGLTTKHLKQIEQQGVEEIEQIVEATRPGTLSLHHRFQLCRQANQALGRRSLFLKKNVTELSRLQEIHEDLNRFLGIEEMLQQVAIRLGTLFPAEVVAFLLIQDEEPLLYYFSKLPLSDSFLKQSQERLVQGFSSIRQQELKELDCHFHLTVPDATQGRIQLETLRTVLTLNLQGREGKIGRMAYFSSISYAFNQPEENMASIIAGEIALALDRANWMHRTEILSITDDLTGLYNHRRFMQILEHEFIRSSRYKTPLCLLMIDIDRFKLLNDTYGHQQGDRMLRALAENFVDATRESDLLTRYGGEEFAIVLPSTDLEGGKVTAERIRTSVENRPFPNPGSPPLQMTVSIGVAYYEGEGLSNPKEFVEQADRALYRAKQQGRNRTVVYSDEL